MKNIEDLANREKKMNTFTYLDFELIKLLYKENNLSQRMISKRLNCSLGKVNETLKKLKELKTKRFTLSEIKQQLDML